MSILGSNAIRSILIIVIGMAITDLGTLAVGELDWKPTIIRYAVAVLAAVLRILSAPVATTSDAAPVV